MVNHVRISDYIRFLEDRIYDLDEKYLTVKAELAKADAEWEKRNWFYRNMWCDRPSSYTYVTYIKHAANEARRELTRATYHSKINELMINCTDDRFFTWADANKVPY